MTKRVRKFAEWSDAEQWAQETDRFLEPCGTYTGDETLMQRYEHMGNYVEMWKRVAEVSAINEHTETIVNIPEYIVVVSMHGQYENLHYANDYDDAHRLFDLESKYLTPIPNATTHAH